VDVQPIGGGAGDEGLKAAVEVREGSLANGAGPRPQPFGIRQLGESFLGQLPGTSRVAIQRLLQEGVLDCGANSLVEGPSRLHRKPRPPPANT
jgi:hypothetical protein